MALNLNLGTPAKKREHCRRAAKASVCRRLPAATPSVLAVTGATHPVLRQSRPAKPISVAFWMVLCVMHHHVTSHFFP